MKIAQKKEEYLKDLMNKTNRTRVIKKKEKNFKRKNSYLKIKNKEIRKEYEQNMASKLKQIEKTQNHKNFDLKKNYSEKMQKAFRKKK